MSSGIQRHQLGFCGSPKPQHTVRANTAEQGMATPIGENEKKNLENTANESDMKNELNSYINELTPGEINPGGINPVNSNNFLMAALFSRMVFFCAISFANSNIWSCRFVTFALIESIALCNKTNHILHTYIES